MSKKIFLISEALSTPFDEGIKNIAYSILMELRKKTKVLSVTNKENNTEKLKVLKFNLNKLLLDYELKKTLKDYSPDIILYIPRASTTFHSFIRAKILKFMNSSAKVVMLGTQRRDYHFYQGVAIKKFLKPDLLLLLGKSDEQFFVRKRIRVKVLPPAVDVVKFCQASEEEKVKIRAEYDIPNDKTVVLHVGHIKINRNIECLLEIQKITDMQVIIVGSTSIIIEGNLKNKLVKAGIRVIDEFIPDVSKAYKMSDIYVFPVINNREAIDMPLSVLEAMACNLPIITTRFRGLVDHFEEDNGFKYFNDIGELVGLVGDMAKTEVHNNKKVERFTWDRFADAIISACDELG